MHRIDSTTFARLLSLALLLMLGAVQAQPAERVYEVELVVFRQAEPTGTDAELRPLDPPPPEAEQVVSLRREGGDAAYSLLEPNQLKLAGVVQSLRQSRYYEPLLHIGWRQPGLGEKEAAAVAVPLQWQPWANGSTPDLFGLVRFYRERYMHVAVDLRYRLPEVDGEVPTLVQRQSRRVNANELHYLDHPGLGVLVQVRPLASQ